MTKRNEKILALRSSLTYSEIAERLGTTRNVVAGVCWRADWPAKDRICSPNSPIPNKAGIGHHGPYKFSEPPK